MLLRISMLMWLSFTTAMVSDDSQYCAIRYRRLCKGKGRHVACQFPDAGPGASCENYTHIQFTKEMQHFILHYINRRRQRIASGNERVRGGLRLPKPKVMTLVEWDRELAALAQRLADQCNFVHDECRATVRFPYAGQTVGEVRWRKSSDSEEQSAQRAIRRVFDAWWGERRRVEPKHLITPFKLTSKGAVWGHFTQLAIWNLRAVGCGAVRHGSSHPRLLLVCDFSHTNMLGQKTLVPGPLAPCPMHTARKPRSTYSLLCAPVRHPQPEEKGHYIEEQYDYDKEYHDADEYDGLVTASNLWVRKTPQTTKAEDEVRKEDDDLIRIQANEKAQTKPAVIDKLQRELEMRSKVEQIKILNSQGHKEWSIKKPHFGEWRQIPETANEETSSPQDLYLTEKVDESNFFYVPISRVMEGDQVVRQKWKHTRARPKRPGANALVAGPTEIIAKPLRRQPPISLTLDKDDVDQLYKDTGFRFSWRETDILRAG